MGVVTVRTSRSLPRHGRCALTDALADRRLEQVFAASGRSFRIVPDGLNSGHDVLHVPPCRSGAGAMPIATLPPRRTPSGRDIARTLPPASLAGSMMNEEGNRP